MQKSVTCERSLAKKNQQQLFFSVRAVINIFINDLSLKNICRKFCETAKRETFSGIIICHLKLFGCHKFLAKLLDPGVDVLHAHERGDDDDDDDDSYDDDDDINVDDGRHSQEANCFIPLSLSCNHCKHLFSNYTRAFKYVKHFHA